MSRFIVPVEQQFTTGSPPAPLSGGKLTFYVTGTSTLAATYSNAALSTPNTNPVILDADGYPLTDIFLNPAVTYRVRLTTSADIEIWDHDPVTGFVAQSEFEALETSLTDQIDTLTNQINEIIGNIWSIGDIFETTNTANPADKYGGTWELFGVGRHTVCLDATQTEFDTISETGGSKTHTNTLEEMFPHDHEVTYGDPDDAVPEMPGGTPSPNPPTVTLPTTEVGGGEPYSIMNPYIVVYRWRRTA